MGGSIVIDDHELNTFAETLELPEHRQLFDYWRSKFKSGRLPARKDFDPIDIPNLLPGLSLIEAVWSQDAPRFRIRLVGTGVVEHFGRDATGLWFEDAYDAEVCARQVADYTQIATTARPSLTQPIAPIPDREHIVCHRLVVPLTNGGDRVEQMMSLMIFNDMRLTD